MLDKKYIISAIYTGIVVLLFHSGYSQVANDQIKKNCLCWKEGLSLEEDYFRNIKIPKGALNNTSIAAISSLDMEIILKSNEGKISFIVYNLFNMDSSWISKDTTDHFSILRHEKIHFDIAEVYTRKLRKELSSFLKEYEYDEIMINEIIEKITLQRRKEQILFDDETNLGLNLERQKYWKDKITKELEELKLYSLSPKIDCPCIILPSSLESSEGDFKEQLKTGNCNQVEELR